MSLPGSLEFDHSRTAARGGMMNVQQPTAQQAPVVVNSQYKDYDRYGNTKDRHRGGADDFESGAALFVACDPDSYNPSKFTKRMGVLGHYMSPEEESQPGVFSSLEQVYLVALNAQPAGLPAVRHAAAVREVYRRVRSFGFADTPNSLQKDNRRYASGDWSVITRIAGDKTTVNTGWMHIGPGDDVVWFLPNDPALTRLNNGTRYPFDAQNEDPMPVAGSVKIRAILVPLTLEVVTVDPNCVFRIVGKCMKPSKPNRALTLLVGTRPSMFPIGLGGNAAAVEFNGEVKLYVNRRYNNPSRAAMWLWDTVAEDPLWADLDNDAGLAKFFSDAFRDDFADALDQYVNLNGNRLPVSRVIAGAIAGRDPNDLDLTATRQGSRAQRLATAMVLNPEFRVRMTEMERIMGVPARAPPAQRPVYRRGADLDAPPAAVRRGPLVDVRDNASDVPEFNDQDLSDQDHE